MFQSSRVSFSDIVDIDYIDHSFGFSSAVEAAQLAIRSAKVEAVCNLPNGIGVVKLMGRSSGFIAAHSTMASSDVDLCLVPEVPLVLEGEKGCLPHLMRRVKEQGYAVVVVAEGAGEDVLGVSAETDAGGNRKLPAIGEFMKAQIEEYFKKHGSSATVKYIDPSYTIRSVPANASDSLCRWKLVVRDCSIVLGSDLSTFFVSLIPLQIVCNWRKMRYMEPWQVSLAFRLASVTIAWPFYPFQNSSRLPHAP
jgi:6-phosphofructokinase